MKKIVCVLIILAMLFCFYGFTAATANAQVAAEAANGQNGTTLSADVSLSARHEITYPWTIYKVGALDRNPGEYYMNEDPVATYTVTLDKLDPVTVKTLSGTVSVTNAGAVATEGLAVTVELFAKSGSSWVSAGVVTIPSISELSASETGSYSYSFTVTGAAGTQYKVTADVTILNHSGSLGEPKGPSPSNSLTFPAATVINDTVNVTDTWYGSLGAFSADGYITYDRHFGPDVAGTFPNTATIVETEQSASASVTITRINNGFTRTIGYWKNHAGFGPQADIVTGWLPVWLGTESGAKSVQITNAADAVKYLGMNGAASNGINKLYAQMLAAKLNIANGASGAAVEVVLSEADAFLAQNDATSWEGLAKANKNKVLQWATTFDNYNNGLIGPGHAAD